MAENKKSFILYTDSKPLVDKLPDDVAGRLFKYLFSYVNDDNPHTEEILLEVSFEHFKTYLKRDLKKWDKYIDKQRLNGAKGGRPKNSDLITITKKKVPLTSNTGHFIYLIYDVVNFNYKIGETKNLIQRRYDIKRPTHYLYIYDFAMLDAYECQKLEREILLKYENSGDWLHISKTEAKEISNIFSQKTQAFNKIPKKADSVSVSVSVNESVNNINNRLAEFKNSLHKFKDDYNSSMLNDFYLYWTEKKPKGKKMLFEMQKTFDISRRLARWDKNNFNKTPKKTTGSAMDILRKKLKDKTL